MICLACLCIMAKGKKGKNVDGHLRARLDYLHKAAAYLQSTAISQPQTRRSGDEAETSSQKVDSSQQANVPVSLDRGATGVVTEKRVGNLDQLHQSKANNLSNASRAYISQLRGISLKTQLRLPQELKRSICKRCDTLLVPGANCTQELRNASREGKKPWADVRVVRCTTCGTEKRYPQADRRSKKLSERHKEQEQKLKQSEKT